MNKKGFTLMELIAVIVILGILALITIPVISDVFNNTIDDVQVKNAEAYLKSISVSISNHELEGFVVNDGVYSIIDKGNICLKNTTADSCDEILDVQANGDFPISGEITIENGEIILYEFEYPDDVVVANGKINPVCILVSGEPGEISSKYRCKVKDDMEEGYERGYYFHILSHNDDGTTNLIMDRNICDDGTVATAENTCLVAWYAGSQTNSKGPVTAMNYLHKGTKDWDNIPNIIVDYEDEGNVTGLGYKSIVTTGSTTKITDRTGKNTTATYENLKARLPEKFEVNTYANCSSERGSCDVWIVNHLLEFYYSYYPISDDKIVVPGIYGFWTLTSLGHTAHEDASINAMNVYTLGRTYYYASDDNTRIGVRPVITLEL